MSQTGGPKVMSISRRVLIGFGALLAVSVCTSGVVYVLSHQAKSDTVHYEQRVSAYHSAVQNLKTDFYNYDDQMNMYVAVLVGDPGQASLSESTYQQAFAARQTLSADLASARRLAPSSQAQATLTRIAADVASYNGFSDQTRAAAGRGATAEALRIQTVGNLQPSNDLMAALQQAESQSSVLAAQALNQVRSQQSIVEWLALIAIALTVTMIAALGALMLVFVFRPLLVLREGIRRAASPDRDRGDRLTVERRDEIGLVAEAFNQLLASLEVREEEVARAQVESEQFLKDRFAGQQEMQRALRRRAQEMIDDTAQTVSRELGEVLQQMAAVRDTTGTIDRQVNMVDDLTHGAVRRAAQMNEVLATFDDSLNRVSAMTKLIADVSNQTRLLALNATIEAARAGEAGHGFTVVANEVKELAAATSASNDQISATVSTLSADARNIVEAIAAVSSSISGVNDSTAALSEIAANQLDRVSQLDRVLADTRDRLMNMTSLTEKLERRVHERTAVVGPATIVSTNGRVRAEMRNISEGGMTVVVPGGEDVPEDGAVVEFELFDRRYTEQFHLVRRSGNQCGLQFVMAGVELTSAIRSLLEASSELAGV
ncbi:MAG: methyl-accepting chemotaxis protein [Acidobacteriota bacterium]|nr:methyl-accepting chemotaxis protein [Acidobacteriota bacterium]